jgi:hypothetical protein
MEDANNRRVEKLYQNITLENGIKNRFIELRISAASIDEFNESLLEKYSENLSQFDELQKKKNNLIDMYACWHCSVRNNIDLLASYLASGLKEQYLQYRTIYQFARKKFGLLEHDCIVIICNRILNEIFPEGVNYDEATYNRAVQQYSNVILSII